MPATLLATRVINIRKNNPFPFRSHLQKGCNHQHFHSNGWDFRANSWPSICRERFRINELYSRYDRLNGHSFSSLCLYSLIIIFNFLIKTLSFIILHSQKLIIKLCTFFRTVSSFSLSISLPIFTYLFILSLCTLLSTNNCNFKMNNLSGSLYPELARLRATVILCVRTGSLLFFSKRRKISEV